MHIRYCELIGCPSDSPTFHIAKFIWHFLRLNHKTNLFNESQT